MVHIGEVSIHQSSRTLSHLRPPRSKPWSQLDLGTSGRLQTQGPKSQQTAQPKTKGSHIDLVLNRVSGVVFIVFITFWRLEAMDGWDHPSEEIYWHGTWSRTSNLKRLSSMSHQFLFTMPDRCSFAMSTLDYKSPSWPSWWILYVRFTKESRYLGCPLINQGFFLWGWHSIDGCPGTGQARRPSKHRSRPSFVHLRWAIHSWGGHDDSF